MLRGNEAAAALQEMIAEAQGAAARTYVIAKQEEEDNPQAAEASRKRAEAFILKGGALQRDNTATSAHKDSIALAQRNTLVRNDKAVQALQKKIAELYYSAATAYAHGSKKEGDRLCQEALACTLHHNGDDAN